MDLLRTGFLCASIMSLAACATNGVQPVVPANVVVNLGGGCETPEVQVLNGRDLTQSEQIDYLTRIAETQSLAATSCFIREQLININEGGQLSESSALVLWEAHRGFLAASNPESAAILEQALSNVANGTTIQAMAEEFGFQEGVQRGQQQVLDAAGCRETTQMINGRSVSVAMCGSPTSGGGGGF